MEFLNEFFNWGAWIILGIILLIFEVLTNTFFILMLAIGAFIVGFVDLFFDTSFTVELSLWIILTLTMVPIWYMWMKKKAGSPYGQAKYKFETLGTTISQIDPYDYGRVKFDIPVLGNKDWKASSKQTIPENTRVKILDVQGHFIIVEKV